MITDQIGRHEVLLKLNNYYNFRENKCMMHFFSKSFQYEILAESLAKVTNLSILENPHAVWWDKWLLLWLW